MYQGDVPHDTTCTYSNKSYLDEFVDQLNDEIYKDNMFNEYYEIYMI